MKIFTALKSLALAAFAAAAIQTATAAPVTFWFSGKIAYINNPSNAAPADIQIGTPFSGRWMFDDAGSGYIAGVVAPSGSVSNYYCRQITGCSVLVQIGGHTITNSAILPSAWSGTVHLYDNYNNADELSFYAGQAGLVADGVVMTNAYFSVYLRDNGKTALATAQAPPPQPTMAAFPNTRSFTWRVSNSSDQFLYAIEGEIEAISTQELVRLNIRNTGVDTAQIAWPAGISGLTLQSTTNLAAANWADVAGPSTGIGMEQGVNVSTAGAPTFYRLTK